MGAARIDGIPLQRVAAQGGDPREPPSGDLPTLIDSDQEDLPVNLQVPDSGDDNDGVLIIIDDLTLPDPINEDTSSAQVMAELLTIGSNRVYLPLIIR